MSLTKVTYSMINGSPVNVLDFGADPTGTDDSTSAIQAAIDAISSEDWFGQVLEVPTGTYKITAALTLPSNNIVISGYGAEFVSTGARCFDIGDAAYLTNLSAGYYYVEICGLNITHSGANEVIRNRGVRKVLLKEVKTTGGSHAFYSEGCFAGGMIDNCRFISATSHGINLAQRNNIFVVKNTSVLSSGGYGVQINTSTAENKGIKLHNVDLEGNVGAIFIAGNSGNIDIDGCWFESNTLFNIKIDNTAGTSNKYAITISNCQITGSGIDVLIGTSAVGTTLDGISVFNNEFANSALTVISGDKVNNFREWANRLSGTATKTLPTSGLLTTSSGVLPLFETAPSEPFGYTATGHQGEIRYSATTGRTWIKVNSGDSAGGWMLTQSQYVYNYSSSIIDLPTGATPSVAFRKSCTTNNSGATSVTSFADGFASQELIIVGNDGGNTTIVHGTNIRLAGGANFTLGNNDTIHLVCTTGTKWVEVSRSDNA